MNITRLISAFASLSAIICLPISVFGAGAPGVSGDDKIDRGSIISSGESKYNEADLEPVDPNSSQVTGCGLKLGKPECPRPNVSYRPDFPKLGDYSVPGVCQSIHDPATVASVTLEQGELLNEAYARLKSRPDSMKGGIIYIPWNVRIQECDKLGIKKKQALTGGVTLSGVLGPNGEMPRMYCRSVKRDGTIPRKAGVSRALSFDKFPGGGRVLVENMHIDGYSTALYPMVSFFVARNNYIHHQLDNGISYSDLKLDKHPWNLLHEYCGNEVSHAGRGNFRHGFYQHRHKSNEFTATQYLVDNVIHSMQSSSAYKSTAEYNYLYKNRVYTSLATDPSFKKRSSTLLLDIAQCGWAEIRGNQFFGDNPAPGGGVDMIAFRNRRGILGCVLPEPAWEG